MQAAKLIAWWSIPLMLSLTLVVFEANFISFSLLEGGDNVRICSPIQYAHITLLYMNNLQLACCRVQNKKQRSCTFLLQSLLLFFLAEEHLSMNLYLFSLYFALFGLFCDNDHLTVRYALHIIKCFWLTLPDSMYTALINHRAIKTFKSLKRWLI